MSLTTLDLAGDAIAEANRLAAARARTRAECEAAFDRGEGLALGPLVTRARHRETRRSLAGRTLLVFRVSWLDGCARVVEWRLIGVLVSMHCSWPASRDGRHFRAMVADAEAAAMSHVEAEAARLDPDVAEVVGRRAAARLDRERAIAGQARAPRSLVQAGLFDRRAERAQQRDASASTECERLLNDRLRAAEFAALHSNTIELVLALVP